MDTKPDLNSMQPEKVIQVTKRPYTPPQLEELANLIDITLGTSNGVPWEAGKPGEEYTYEY
jgi:hypothetical protein